MKLSFLDRAKKLLHQIDVSLLEEDYDLIEINAQVLFNLIKEKQEEAFENKKLLEDKLNYLLNLTPRIKDSIQPIIERLQQPPLQWATGLNIYLWNKLNNNINYPPGFNNKEWLLNQIKLHVSEERVEQVDYDFLMYEISTLPVDQLELLFASCLMKDENNNRIKFKSNPHNSIILYITECTDEFDFVKARSNMINGSAPDVDIDHDALDREKAIEWCVDYWGRDNVANIITHGTFKPKSLARSYYRITEGNMDDLDELLKKIPPPKFGKESTLTEILDLNPDLKEEPK